LCLSRTQGACLPFLLVVAGGLAFNLRGCNPPNLAG
jgi:hypothetical protein